MLLAIGKTIRLICVVTEHMDEVILSFNWLQAQEAVSDFRTGQLTIEGEIHFLVDEVDAAKCRQLVVRDYVVVPARSQMDIVTKTVYSNLKATRDPEGSSWMTESREDGQGLQVSRTMVLNPDRRTRQGDEGARLHLDLVARSVPWSQWMC